MTTLAQIASSQAQKEVTANENFNAVACAGFFGRKYTTTTGLTWGFYGGILPNLTVVADGTVALTNAATNYIEANPTTGAVTANTSGWTAGKFALYTAVCAGSVITAWTDYRSMLNIGEVSLSGDNTWTGHQNFAAGTVLLPSVYFGGDSTSGIYRIGANNLGFAISATKLLDLAAGAFGVVGDINVTGTGAVKLAVGTTAQRPTGADGKIRYNSDTKKYEGYGNSAWSLLGGGATGGGTDAVFVENDQTVTTNYTLTTGKNAESAGPITVNAGVVVTVPAGQRWVIV